MTELRNRWPLRLIALWCLGAGVAAAHPLGRAPGRLIDVDGHRMHLYCQGQGVPTVVIDTGLGGTSLEWQPVMQRVAHFAQVCVYDRAGYGWSDMEPYPRTSSIEVNELHQLLHNAGLSGPFVVVGHSYGGYNAQLFARRYPRLTAGVVLVDASHPEQIERFEAPPYHLNTAPISRFGVVQFKELPALHPSLSPQARLLTLYQYQNWRPRRTISYELLGFRDSARELRAEPPFPAVPLVVLSRGKRVWPVGPHGDQLEQLWLALQGELAAQSPTSAQILARDSGHLIHLERPALVAYGIALVADASRAGAPPSPTAVQSVESRDGTIFETTWLSDTLNLRTSSAVVALHPVTATIH